MVADGLKCPFCSSMKSEVIDKRGAKKKGIFYIRRRRVCLACNKRFTTYENIVNTSVEKKTVIKTIKNLDAPKIRKVMCKYIYRCSKCKSEFGSDIIVIGLRCFKCKSKDIWLI